MKNKQALKKKSSASAARKTVSAKEEVSKKKSKKQTSPEKKKAEGVQTFPVVGIGGSAGGLKRLLLFYSICPPTWVWLMFIFNTFHQPMKVFCRKSYSGK